MGGGFKKIKREIVLKNYIKNICENNKVAPKNEK